MSCPCPKPLESKTKPAVELASIFRNHIGDYQQKYNLHPDHFKAVNDILNCRTAYLGGHIEKCDTCGIERHAYNSCRNRHCPKCQTMAKARWLEARMAELLPTQYFHNVFTLPHEINPIALCNKGVVYRILFKAVSSTLLQFGKNPDKGLGGDLGLIAILHTWDQQLNYHLHLHCVVPGGALCDGGARWNGCSKDFLFPVKALSKVFRAKFMEAFKKAYENGDLIFPGETAPLGTRTGFKKLTKRMWGKKWVVYSKKPFSGPETVLEYLAGYTHRVAISNHRIRSLEEGKVTFSYRNREKDTKEEKTLDATEFTRRFLLHVVPKNFMRIRHFGFLANRCKKKNITRCRELLGTPETLPGPVDQISSERSVQELMLALTGTDITRCPSCKKGTMKIIAELPELTGPSAYDFINWHRIKGVP